MKRYTQSEIESILKNHMDWILSNGSDGFCANLYRADLSDANLSGANLYRANLSGADLSDANLRGDDLSDANLRYADLSGANLYRANLSGADLSDANLRGDDLSDADLSGANLYRANLSGADLSDANLRYADLSGANLYRANLYRANMSGANLSGANLCRANLFSANLSGADLSDANLRDANLSKSCLRNANIADVQYDARTSMYALACPEKGEFIGYKKANGYIVELLVTADAKRSSATTRKCRCSKAKVLSITNQNGEKIDIEKVASDYDYDFFYTVGETVEVRNFCEDRWKECAPGIHFFITREEAVRYDG